MAINSIKVPLCPNFKARTTQWTLNKRPQLTNILNQLNQVFFYFDLVRNFIQAEKLPISFETFFARACVKTVKISRKISMGWRIPSLFKSSNFLSHQLAIQSGNSASHSSGNGFKATPVN